MGVSNVMGWMCIGSATFARSQFPCFDDELDRHPGHKYPVFLPIVAIYKALPSP